MTRAPAKPKPFATEAALCAAFIKAVGEEWVCYNETANWDILLVRKIDGFQIGIQAKLRFGVDVINQAIEDGWTYQIAGPHPDCRAVLVPQAEDKGFGKICDALGLNVILAPVARLLYPVMDTRPHACAAGEAADPS